MIQIDVKFHTVLFVKQLIQFHAHFNFIIKISKHGKDGQNKLLSVDVEA
jgi:hypothetical protein